MQYTEPHLVGYYFGRLQRDEIESILRRKGCQDGLFLLRQHLDDPGLFVLSICHNKEIKHYKFERRKKKFHLGNSKEFDGPVELIEYLKSNQTQLITKPIIPCNRFNNTQPVNYLFVSCEEFDDAVEKEIEKRCKASEINYAKTVYRYKYERFAIKTLHVHQSWYKKNTNKAAAEKLFKEHGKYNGKFLLRSNRLRRYKLCLCFEDVIYHYAINYTDKRYSIEGTVGEEFENLIQLIDYYGRRQGVNLKCKLTMPYDNEMTSIYVCDTNEFYNAFVSGNEEYLSHFRSIKNLIPYSHITMKIPSTKVLDKIAEGNESRIFKALCVPKFGTQEVVVAVKIIKKKTDQLIKEARILTELNNQNIVRIIEPAGTFQDEDAKNSVLITEYAALGSFSLYLKQNEDLKPLFLVNVLKQVASALVYISSKNIVHRDIAARNVLLFNKNLAKICDFGLARKVENDSNYYSSVEEQTWPIKWYPPEVFKLRRFNESSDVWSFGVLIWETFSNGDVPFGDINAFTYEQVQEFFDDLQSGKLKLERPAKCSNENDNLMNSCLNIDYNSRPQFNEIYSQLKAQFETLSEERRSLKEKNRYEGFIEFKDNLKL